MLRDFNWKKLIAVGLLAGLIQVAAGVVMYLAGIYFVPWSMAINLAVLLICIVNGGYWYRDSVLKGEISYRQALVVGIVISVCSGIVYAIYNLVSISFFYPNFLESTINARLATVPANERTPELIAAMREGVTAKTIALSNMIRLSLLGSFLSIFLSFRVKKTADLRG